MGCGSSSNAKISSDDNSKSKKAKKSGELDYRPVHSACRWNTASIDEMKKLLIDPRSVNCVDPGNGNTPLHIAAQNGHSEIVTLLITLQASLNAQNGSGNTPLHMSIEYDYYETSKLLVDAGADLDVKNQKEIPVRKGIEGTKHWLFMPLLSASDEATVMQVLKACEASVEDLEKSSFAAMGLRTKKALGVHIWTDEAQELFKVILRKTA